MTNNFDDILQQVVDKLANKQRDGGLNAANLLTKFWGKQLLPSDLFNKAKTESKESNDPRKKINGCCSTMLNTTFVKNWRISPQQHKR